MNSCGYGAGAYRELADIESYAAERPDSALQALEKIDARGSAGRRSGPGTAC